MVSTWYFRPSVNQGLESANPGPPRGCGKTTWSPWLLWEIGCIWVCFFSVLPKPRYHEIQLLISTWLILRVPCFVVFRRCHKEASFLLGGVLKGQPHPIQWAHLQEQQKQVTGLEQSPEILCTNPNYRKWFRELLLECIGKHVYKPAC